MSINRAVRRPHERAYSPETFTSLKTAPESPLGDLLQAEEARQVRGGLNRLRELDRKTLLAFYFEGRSIKQMSDDFDRPIGTIKRRLHTARHRLREQLDELRPV
jgi:RNA polymerase sigma-70 factor (ECF subfamily)